jgi:uncharacterized membrane protein
VTPRWVERATLVLAVVAIGISAYLTVAHYTSPTLLACVENGLVNCTRVTTSRQSTFAGIPVAVLGLGWSSSMAAVCLPVSWRSSNRGVHVARVTLAALGIAFVLWLVYAELFVIRAICLWCTAMHLVTFALFALILLYATPERVQGHASRDDVRG